MQKAVPNGDLSHLKRGHSCPEMGRYGRTKHFSTLTLKNLHLKLSVLIRSVSLFQTDTGECPVPI